jgi:hypothetical protein
MKKIRSGNFVLRVVSLEDMIKMKQKSASPQDLEDIKALRSLKQ